MRAAKLKAHELRGKAKGAVQTQLKELKVGEQEASTKGLTWVCGVRSQAQGA